MRARTFFLTRSGIIHAYVDFLEVKRDGQHVVNAVAGLLKLDNAPYPTQESIKILVPFTDDLITLSENAKGVAIIVDNAEAYLHENSREMFEFIEDFLLQFYHWFEKKKPCHLCFQMEKSDWAKRIFGANLPPLR